MSKFLLAAAVLLGSCAIAQAEQQQTAAQPNVRLSLPISEALGWGFLKEREPAAKDQVFSFGIAGTPAPTGFHNFVIAN